MLTGADAKSFDYNSKKGMLDYINSRTDGLQCVKIKPTNTMKIPAVGPTRAHTSDNTRLCFEVEPANRITYGYVDDPSCFCPEGREGNCWCPDAKVECIRIGQPDEFMPSKGAADATDDVTERNQWISRKDNGYRVYYLL